MTETPENTPETTSEIAEELVDAPVAEDALEEEGADVDGAEGSDGGDGSDGGGYEPPEDDGDIEPISIEAVSYTHLTLPTIYSV